MKRLPSLENVKSIPCFGPRSATPLATAPFVLPVPGAHVVGDCVAQDIVQCPRGLYVPAGFSDDDGELAFVVGLGHVRGNHNWLARVNLLHAFSHDDLAPVAETPTPGYNDLRAEVSYRWKPMRRTSDSLTEMVVGISGHNLLNEPIRNSVSYSKDEVLMPGAGVRLFANLKY